MRNIIYILFFIYNNANTIGIQIFFIRFEFNFFFVYFLCSDDVSLFWLELDVHKLFLFYHLRYIWSLFYMYFCLHGLIKFHPMLVFLLEKLYWIEFKLTTTFWDISLPHMIMRIVFFHVYIYHHISLLYLIGFLFCVFCFIQNLVSHLRQYFKLIEGKKCTTDWIIRNRKFVKTRKCYRKRLL